MSLFMSQDCPKKTGVAAERDGGGVPAFWGHRSLCESGDIYGAFLQKMHMIDSHKIHIVHETFALKPTQEF